MAKDPSFNWKDIGKKTSHQVTDSARSKLMRESFGRKTRYQQIDSKSRSRAAARSTPSRGMSLAQLEKQAMRQAPGIAMGEMPLSHGAEIARGPMANKLLKGGGGLRLPQMGKGGMKAMLPMLLLMLLAGGMGGGNEDLDGMLG